VVTHRLASLADETKTSSGPFSIHSPRDWKIPAGPTCRIVSLRLPMKGGTSSGFVSVRVLVLSLELRRLPAEGVALAAAGFGLAFI